MGSEVRTLLLLVVIVRPLMQLPFRHLGLLANMELVPLRMNSLLLVHVFTTQKRLVTLVTRHYEAQAMAQLYRIIGSSEFIGSPVSLVSNLGTGVIDFFYEPAQVRLCELRCQNFWHHLVFSLSMTHTHRALCGLRKSLGAALPPAR